MAPPNVRRPEIKRSATVLGCEATLDKQHGTLRSTQKFEHEMYGHPVLVMRARAVETALCLLAKSMHSVHKVEVEILGHQCSCISSSAIPTL